MPSATASAQSPPFESASLTGGIVLDQAVQQLNRHCSISRNVTARWLTENHLKALGGPAVSLDKAQMLQSNSQISLVTAELFYRPPAASNALAFPTNRSKRTKHRAKFCEVLDRR
jgi:hypothetical protein